jgi:CBS domain-containing protein
MGITVAEVMTPVPISVSPEMTLLELDEVFVEFDVSGVPVVHADQLVGVVSQSDVVRMLLDEQLETRRISAFYAAPIPISIPELEQLARNTRQIADHLTEARVGDLMTRDPIVVHPTDPIELAAAKIVNEGIHRVLVVDGDRLVGLVTATDLAALLLDPGLGY